MDISLLEEIGLTSSEIKVYLALLELGSSTTGPIAEKAEVASSKIYELLQKLLEKGLVSFVVKANMKYFEAADPVRILDYVEERERRFFLQKQKIKQLLPELELKRTLQKYHSDAKVYKGIKGLQSAFYEALREMKNGSKIYCYGIPKRSNDVNRFFVHFHNDCKKKNVFINYLFTLDAKGELQTSLENGIGEVKYLPASIYTPAAVNIFGDRVIIFPYESNGEVILFSLKNKNIAASFKAQFDVFWNQQLFTYEGKEAIRQLFVAMIEFGDYVVFAEGMKIVELLGNNFFLWWQTEKKMKGIHSRGIIGEKYRDKITVKDSTTEFKFIPHYENPGVTFVFKNKVVIINFAQTPVAFLIESKESAQSYHTYFELLWNQKVQVYEGKKDATVFFNTILTDIAEGDEYFVINGNYGSIIELKQFFQKYHQLRVKKNIKANLLFNANIRGVEKSLALPPAEYKFLPEDFKSPLQITFYKNKLYISLWQKPVLGFLIESREVVDAFKAYFDHLWKQGKK